MSMPPFNAITEASIATLIERFYVSVRHDPLLGPIFEEAIAPDEWPEHLATMQRFWSSVMLASRRYSGDPLAVHRAVRGIEPTLFARWLGLFETTAQALFAPPDAEAFATKARRIATSLQLALFPNFNWPADRPMRAG